MRLGLVLCVLLLVAPAAARAAYPVISYVDENGVFRLYEAELGREVDPPPPVPANFPGFRYGISLDGRYIVWGDVDKKLHLLDRATNTQIPLPGIDVYTAAGPDNLSVSNTGLIAFDNNGNGPAVVYDSAAGQFIDTGLPASNGHRQTRLSADGHYLATTCDDTAGTCVAALDLGVDPYVQDLSTRSDTGFPNDALADEEHPCIDADGSLVGFDKVSGVLQRDVFMFDRSVPTPQPVTLTGLNDSTKNETNCVLDAAGDYLGFLYDTTTFRVYQRSSGDFLALPADKEFDSRSLFSAAYTPPPPPGGGAAAPPPSGDRTKPVLSRVQMTQRRFRVRPRATAFRFTLSEPAGMRIVLRRFGRYAGELRRRGLAAGAHRIAWGGRLRGRRVRPGAYAAVLIATDAVGNRSLPRLIEFRVLRPRR